MAQECHFPCRKLMRYYKDQAGLRDDVVEFLWVKRKIVTRVSALSAGSLSIYMSYGFT